MDLMDLLSWDADLGDIGALLQADDENIELEESQEEFELQADAVGGEDDLLAGLTEEPDVEAKKPGFFQKVLSSVETTAFTMLGEILLYSTKEPFCE